MSEQKPKYNYKHILYHIWLSLFILSTIIFYLFADTGIGPIIQPLTPDTELLLGIAMLYNLFIGFPGMYYWLYKKGII